MSDLSKILANEPAFRIKQIELAKFDLAVKGYEDITTLSKELREQLKDFPWLSVKNLVVKKSKIDGTQKAILILADNNSVETVLMFRKDRWTVCLSSQAGCSLNCSFCATGQAGFKRNLTKDEIVDQYRFWQKELGSEEKIENIVLMGQGEPLLNYLAVKEALKTFLVYGKIAPRKIILSTVGIVEGMNKILTDDDFPKIRFAISLHSAINKTRKKIIPSHPKDFFDFLITWSKKYHEKFSSRNFFIGLEYLLLTDFNDDDEHLNALIKLSFKLGSVRINLIPFNKVGKKFGETDMTTAKKWQEKLNDKGLTATIRRSQGSDIEAACGQLAEKIDPYSKNFDVIK
jgi:23S rRNA (adenine2503-C2)-methyltransferase